MSDFTAKFLVWNLTFQLFEYESYVIISIKIKNGFAKCRRYSGDDQHFKNGSVYFFFTHYSSQCIFNWIRIRISKTSTDPLENKSSTVFNLQWYVLFGENSTFHWSKMVFFSDQIIFVNWNLNVKTLFSWIDV